MDRVTRTLFSDIGKVTTQYVEVSHQQLKPRGVWTVPMFYGIYDSDLRVPRGGHLFIKPPIVPGHEIAAHVAEVGSGIKNIQPGDCIMVGPTTACMECRAYKAGRFNLCELPQVAGFRTPGFAHSQHIVPARNYHVVPVSLPLEMLVFAEPAACARHCVNRVPKASLESVLVIDAGAIGLFIVQALHIMGAGKITAIGPDAAKRALALELGAAEVWAPGELAADVWFTEAIDVVAAQATLNDAYTRVYAGDTVVYMGMPGGPRGTPLPIMQRFERDLLNSGIYIPEDFDAAIEWLTDGRSDTGELVTDLFVIGDAAAAFERAQQNGSIKVMLQSAPE